MTTQTSAAVPAVPLFAAPAAAPGAGNTPPPPPSASTPPGVNLRSGIGAAFTGPFPWDGALISVAADGTLWMATVDPGPGASGLLTYDFGQAATRPVFATESAVILSLSAVSASEAWVVFDDGAGNAWLGHWAGGTMNRGPALPGGAAPAQVSAAADGTVWVLSTAGAPYAVAAGAATPVPAPGLTLAVVSVGAADHVLALGGAPGAAAGALSWSPSGGWAPFLDGAPGQWIAACADGAAWLLAGGGVLIARLPDGTERPMDVSSIGGALSWTAASRMSAYAWCVLENGPGVVPVSMGVLDLPPVPWPAMTPGEQAAYDALSALVGVTAAGGLRTQYTNKLEPFSDWYTIAVTASAPSGIDPADWKRVQKQVATELLYVRGVYNLFSEMATLTGYIGTIQADQLQGVAAEVDLTAEKQGQSEVTVLLNALTQTLLTRVGSLFPPPYGLAVSLIGAGLAAAANWTGQKYNAGDSSRGLTVAYAHLSAALADNLAQAVVEQEKQQAAVLSDWGRLSAAGQAIAQGIWSWPVELTGQSLKGIEPVMQLYFFQALMPARWQILQGQIVFMTGPFMPPAKPRAPDHAMMTRSVQDARGNELVWFYVCCGLGSRADIVQNSGPWPDSTLLQDIFGLGVEPKDLFAGRSGWALPTAQSPGWSDPPAQVPWNPYGG